MEAALIMLWIWNAIMMALLIGVYIRVGNMLEDLRRLHRTGVLIEDIKSSSLKPIRFASPRQKQRYIERVINQEK